MRNLLAISCAAIALLAAGCASSKPVHYYSLSTPPPANDTKANGPVILVGLIATPESLQDARIRYHSAANEVGGYEYHRWEERPGAMVRLSLVRALRATGQYQRVLESTSSAAAGYLLRGQLYEFAELDNPSIRTRISLQLELVDRKTNLTVWDRHFEREEPAGGKRIEDVVASMDRNLQALVATAASGISTYFLKP